MSRLLFLLSCLGLGRALPGTPAAPGLPPPPDSLRATLRAARTAPARQAAWLRTAAAFVNEGPDSAGAATYARAAEALARRRADSAGVGYALSLRGYLYLQLGDLARAAPLLRRAERLLASGPALPRADNDGYLAWLLGDTNQPTAALRYLRRAHAAYGRLGLPARQAELSGTACLVYTYLGQGDSAVYVLLQAARQQRRLGLAEDEISTLGNLASILHQLDRLPEAERYARRYLAAQQRQGAVSAHPYTILGNIAWARHQNAQAVAYYRTGIRLMRSRGLDGNLATVYGSMGGAMADLGQGDSAVYYQTKALRLCQQLGQTSQAVVEMGALAQVYLQLRRWTEAEYWARASLRAQGSQQLQSTRPLIVLEQVAEQRGHYREALRLEHQIRLADNARAARESQRLVQEQRARFETDQAEQRVAMLTSRTRLQAQARELERLRARQELAGIGALSLLTLGLIGGLVWRYRRRQAAREDALRTSLAADLHDDVGSLLTQISMQSTMLREGLYPPEQQHSHLQHMAETSRRAARQMRDVVWGIDARNDSFECVLDRMRDHAHQVLPPAGLELDFASDPALLAATIPLSTRQALYLIYKEALHNAIKHAGASQVTVRLRQQGRLLELAVRDDGRGGALPARPAGQGLRNMQQRAAAAAGTVRYDTGGPGFGVVAQLPLS